MDLLNVILRIDEEKTAKVKEEARTKSPAISTPSDNYQKGANLRLSCLRRGVNSETDEMTCRNKEADNQTLNDL